MGASELINETKLHQRLAFLVVNDTAIALAEAESATFSANEDDAEFEAHSTTRVITDPTREQPEFEVTGARGTGTEALDELGIRDDADEGRYTRGAGRELDEAEWWIYETDADVTADEPAQKDRFENFRVNLDSIEYGDDAVTFDIELVGDADSEVYFDYEPSA